MVELGNDCVKHIWEKNRIKGVSLDEPGTNMKHVFLKDYHLITKHSQMENMTHLIFQHQTLLEISHIFSAMKNASSPETAESRQASLEFSLNRLLFYYRVLPGFHWKNEISVFSGHLQVCLEERKMQMSAASLPHTSTQPVQWELFSLANPLLVFSIFCLIPAADWVFPGLPFIFSSPPSSF